MSWMLLILLAFPTLGISTSISRSFSANEQQSETEEVEERIPSSSQRRAEQERSTRGGFLTPMVHIPWRTLSLAIQPRPPVDGHRIASGSLAPMRC